MPANEARLFALNEDGQIECQEPADCPQEDFVDTENKKVVRYACDIDQKLCVEGLLILSCLTAGCIFRGTPLTHSTGNVGQTISSLGGLHQGQGGE